jgi:hypothetical protein
MVVVDVKGKKGFILNGVMSSGTPSKGLSSSSLSDYTMVKSSLLFKL